MAQGEVRIIAGKWRGRRLMVPDMSGLRPTPDRVRETVFNWLTPYIVGARCLDVFAGSGALGFEALSRGASYVEMVDEAREVVRVLEQQAQVLQAETARIYQADVPVQLKVNAHPFDIVFIDPPYRSSLLTVTCEYLEKNGYLAPSAYIYLEAGEPIKDNDLPCRWHIIKSKQAGQVFYHLAHREAV